MRRGNVEKDNPVQNHILVCVYLYRVYVFNSLLRTPPIELAMCENQIGSISDCSEV